MRLDQLPLNCPGIVQGLSDEHGVTRRLQAMGFNPGVQVTVTRRAPLGDPIALKLHGYELSLRCQEASLVHVSPQEPGDVTRR